MSSRAPQRPEKEVIAAARTVSVFVAFGPEELKSELTNELAKSFPWQP